MGDRESERLCPGPLGFEEESSLPARGLETKPWVQGPTVVHMSHLSLLLVNQCCAQEATGHGKLWAWPG